MAARVVLELLGVPLCFLGEGRALGVAWKAIALLQHARGCGGLSPKEPVADDVSRGLVRRPDADQVPRVVIFIGGRLRL